MLGVSGPVSNTGLRDITTFPFPPTLKNKILNAGFKDVRDFGNIRPVELARGIDLFCFCLFFFLTLKFFYILELKITNEEALQILKTIKDNSLKSLPQTFIGIKLFFFFF